jgi:hypothetical protein
VTQPVRRQRSVPTSKCQSYQDRVQNGPEMPHAHRCTFYSACRVFPDRTYAVHEVESKPGPLQTKGSGTQNLSFALSVGHLPDLGRELSVALEVVVDGGGEDEGEDHGAEQAADDGDGEGLKHLGAGTEGEG